MRMRLLQSGLVAAFATWAAEAEEAARVRGLLRRVAARLGQRTLALALTAWADAVLGAAGGAGSDSDGSDGPGDPARAAWADGVVRRNGVRRARRLLALAFDEWFRGFGPTVQRCLRLYASLGWPGAAPSPSG